MSAQPFSLNTPQLRELIAAKRLAMAAQSSAVGEGGSEEAPPISFLEAIAQEPTMARPQWVDAELTSLATQWGMHGERNAWATSFRPKYWRPPTEMSDSKVAYPPTGTAVGPSSSTAGPSSSAASAGILGGGRSLLSPPPSLVPPQGASAAPQQQQQTPQSARGAAHSRCPFGTFYEDADVARVRIGS